MKRRAILTVLEDNPGLAKSLAQELARAGFDVAAHCWVDDLKQMGWLQAARELAAPETNLWVIAGTLDSLAARSIRQGLSLAALAAQDAHGTDFPIVISPATTKFNASNLPTPLASAAVAVNGIGAKGAARCAMAKGRRPAYRLVPHGLPGLGLWFEAGTASEPWKGALFGTCGAEPDAQGVGPAGTIPSTCTLHHPTRGLVFEVGGRSYTAWGAMNELTPRESHYVRVTGVPEAISFGAFPNGEDAEMWTLVLA